MRGGLWITSGQHLSALTALYQGFKNPQSFRKQPGWRAAFFVKSTQKNHENLPNRVGMPQWQISRPRPRSSEGCGPDALGRKPGARSFHVLLQMSHSPQPHRLAGRLTSHFCSSNALRSRSVSNVVLSATLDVPAPPARLIADWQRERRRCAWAWSPEMSKSCLWHGRAGWTTAAVRLDRHARFARGACLMRRRLDGLPWRQVSP